MKPNPIFTLLALLGIATTATASSRSSASYELAVESTGPAGGRSASASYTLDSSTGGHGGVSSSAGGDTVAKTGYPGQLYDVQELALTADPDTVGEGSARQLSAAAVLDDLTLLDLDGGDVLWEAVSGPIVSVGAGGLATAGTVFEDTPGVVGGSYSGVSGEVGLTVLDIDHDDFEEYGGDGLDDGWQVDHFGAPPNEDAGPGGNPDNDPSDNLGEFLTGFDPNDGADFFRVSMVSLVGDTATLSINKVIPGRIYTLTAGSDANAFGETVTSFGVASEAAGHEIDDPAAASLGTRKLYRMEVREP